MNPLSQNTYLSIVFALFESCLTNPTIITGLPWQVEFNYSPLIFQLNKNASHLEL